MTLLKNPRLLRFAINLWPPYWGTGISIRSISSDYRQVIVQLKLRWYNRNYVGTHFGGSLSAMVDPFYMIMLINILGREYVVWDQSSRIRFISPGKGTVTATFSLNDRQIEDIVAKTATGEKYVPMFDVDIVDNNGDLIAKATKEIYIRKKRKPPIHD